MQRIFSIATLILLLATTKSFAAFPTAGTMAIPKQAKAEALKGEIRVGDTFKLALLVKTDTAGYPTTGYSDPDNVTTFSATGEVSGTGYSRATLASCAVTISGTDARFTCTSPSWGPTATITADSAVIYDDTCDGSTRCSNADQVLGIFAFTSTTSTASTFNLTLPANLFTIQ